MQCTYIPDSTCKDIYKLNRYFLFGSSNNKIKLHALKYNTITLPELNGWLNISLTRERNLALLDDFP